MKKVFLKHNLKNAIEDEEMKTAVIRSNLECNMACLFCTAADDSSKKMSIEEIKGKIDGMSKEGIDRLMLTGGEPTLRADLSDIIVYALSAGIKLVDPQSNAIIFSNEDYVLKMKKAGLNFVTVGFPSHKKEKYNHLTASQFYTQAVRGINNLVKNEIDVCVYHVINSENYLDLEEFIDFIQAISKKISFAFAFLRPNGNTQRNKHLVPKLSQIELQLRKMFSYLQKKKISAVIEGVPLCYLDGFEINSVETRRLLRTPVPYISEDEVKHNSLYDDINTYLKKKNDSCKLCSLNSYCVGIWKEYAEIHGVLELYPLFINKSFLEVLRR